MNEQNFQLKADRPFIELNKLLQILHIAQSGGHAKILILNEEVTVNGVIETRIRNKLVRSDKIMVGNYLIRIS